MRAHNGCYVIFRAGRGVGVRIPGDWGYAEGTGAGRYVLSGTGVVTLFVCGGSGDCVWLGWSLSVVVLRLGVVGV